MLARGGNNLCTEVLKIVQASYQLKLKLHMRQIGLPHLYVIIYSFLFVVLLGSCSPTKNIKPSEYLYFRNGADTIPSKQMKTVIQSNDLLSIQVYSKTPNQEQAAIYNMPTPSTTNNTMGAAPGTAPGYQVDAAGNIEIPVIGIVKAAGLTTSEISCCSGQFPGIQHQRVW